VKHGLGSTIAALTVNRLMTVLTVATKCWLLTDCCLVGCCKASHAVAIKYWLLIGCFR